jgi:hypothetical protein
MKHKFIVRRSLKIAGHNKFNSRDKKGESMEIIES